MLRQFQSMKHWLSHQPFRSLLVWGKSLIIEQKFPRKTPLLHRTLTCIIIIGTPPTFLQLPTCFAQTERPHIHDWGFHYFQLELQLFPCNINQIGHRFMNERSYIEVAFLCHHSTTYFVLNHSQLQLGRHKWWHRRLTFIFSTQCYCDFLRS